MILHYKFRSLSPSCRKLMRYLDQRLEEKRRLGTLMVILDVCMLAQRCTTSIQSGQTVNDDVSRDFDPYIAYRVTPTGC